MEKHFNDLLSSHIPLYILYDMHLNKPIGTTLFPDINRVTTNYNYLQFQMRYDIPLIGQIDWTNTINNPEYTELESKLGNMEKYHVFAKYEQYENGKMVEKREILYYGPSKEVAKKVKLYFTTKYGEEDKWDSILEKTTNHRDFKFYHCHLVQELKN